jgi:hypothetical protein
MPGSENAKHVPQKIACIRNANSVREAIVYTPKAFLHTCYPPESTAGYVERARCGLLYGEVHDAITNHKEDPREVLDRLQDPTSTFMERLSCIGRPEALRHLGSMYYSQNRQKRKASVEVMDECVRAESKGHFSKRPSEYQSVRATTEISSHSPNELSQRALDFGFFDCADDNPEATSYCVNNYDVIDSLLFHVSDSYCAPLSRSNPANTDYPPYFLLFPTAVIVIPGIPNGGVCSHPMLS